MNLIIKSSRYVKYHTIIHPFFEIIPELPTYRWLISSFEVNHCPDERLKNDPVIVEGEILKNIVALNDIQFIWGVFSAFKNDEDLRASVKKRLPLPYACGNATLWKDSPKPQAKNAVFEIVCWDSSCTLFIGISESMAQAIQKRYPDVKAL